MQYLLDLAAIAGAVSTIATVLAHLPLVPARAQEFFAHVGITFGRFAVAKKPDGVS